MNSKKATIQLYASGEWIDIGEFEPTSTSHENGGYFEYNPEYVIAKMGNNLPFDRAGLNYPVNFDLYKEQRWHPFLLDILPSGAGRRVWARRLEISENYSSDWQLLMNGAGNAPGNIRIKEAHIQPIYETHPGFSIDDIVEKNADFIEYAESMGAAVAGASDVGGDAPKFMLTQDTDGRWHPEGGICDEKVMECWLVKFPRGKKDKDATVLRNEAPYYEVARWFGIRTGKPLHFINDALFIPRFDRLHGTPFVRHGLETIASAAGISGYGIRTSHIVISKAIAKFSTDPKTELQEYLRREILNTALRNTDNHPRNTSFIKYANGTVQLSPLYDFAPMFLDPEGVARGTKWGADAESNTGSPDWIAVCHELQEVYPDTHELMTFVSKLTEKVEQLPAIMQKVGVETAIIDELIQRIDKIAKNLKLVGKAL